MGWQIEVDFPTLNRYRKVDHPELGPALREHVQQGRIRLGPDLACPFLRPDRLCRIQAELGESYLSLTCASYPRVQHLVDGEGIRAATLSCPEAARLALLDPGAMALQPVEDPSNRRIAGSRMDTGSYDALDPRKLYHFLRERILELLQAREVSPETRLYALGRALHALQREDALVEDDVDLIFAAIRHKLPEMAAELAEARAPQDLKFSLLGNLFADQFERVGGGHRHACVVARAAAGLGYRNRADFPALAGAFRRAAREHLAPYFALRPHVLENFLVNQVLSSTFPYGAGRSWFQAYEILVVKVAVLKLLLAGVAAHEGRMDDLLLVEVVQTYQRAVDHSHDYLGDLGERLVKAGVDTLAHMVMLIAD